MNGLSGWINIKAGKEEVTVCKSFDRWEGKDCQRQRRGESGTVRPIQEDQTESEQFSALGYLVSGKRYLGMGETPAAMFSYLLSY